MISIRLIAGLVPLLLAACQPGAESPEKPVIPGEAGGQPWAGIGPQDIVQFTGTEPFWGGEVQFGTLTWKTPEDPDGVQIPVERFAGRNGLGFNGMLEAMPFELAISEAPCRDGMSDRTYPFTATVRHGTTTLNGCAWTQARSFSGSQQP
jgi:uncharacterized membrane protein